jgi:homoserine kinase
MDETIAAALEAGALGACLSGSGPTILALTHGREEAVADAMRQALSAVGVAAVTRVLEVSLRGAVVTRRSVRLAAPADRGNPT